MKLDSKQLPSQIIAKLKQLARYRVIIVTVLVVALYGFLILQINNASNAPANSEEVVATRKSVPRIDEQTIEQLKQLQDNNVNVQALFNDARSNPFQ